MSSLYMGIAATGRKYNTLADCFAVLNDEDVIMVDPMADNAYYTFEDTFPTDKSLFIKADIEDDYDHLNLLSDNAYKVRFYGNSTSSVPVFHNSGIYKTINLVFESVFIDLNTFGMKMGTTPYGNFLFNKCRIRMSESGYGMLSSMIRGVVEFRNCHLEFLNGTSTYLCTSMDSGAIVNLIKCTTNYLTCINGPGVNGNSRLFNVEINDVIDYKIPIENYGVTGGKQIVANNRPVIAGRILDNGNPVVKKLHLFLKTNQRRVATVTSDSTGYFEFDIRNYLTDSLILGTFKNPASSNEFIILNDVKGVDPRIW